MNLKEVAWRIPLATAVITGTIEIPAIIKQHEGGILSSTQALNKFLESSGIDLPLSSLGTEKAEAGPSVDFDINFESVKGRFFTQGILQKASGSPVEGFAVLDTRKAPLWSEFNKLGGVTRFGYPVSNPWTDGLGRVNQAFQNGILRVNVSGIGSSNWVDVLTNSQNLNIPDQAKVSQDVEQIRKAEIAAEALIDMSKYVLQSYPGESSTFEQMTPEGPALTTISVLPPENFCGETVRPLLFTKDKLAAYWARGLNLDLKWFLKGFKDVDGIEYYVVLGDKRFDRETGALVRQTNYGSLSMKNRSGGFTTIPAYALFPRFLRINDTINSQQTYSEQCSEQGEKWFANWTVWYEKKQVATPFYKGEAVAVTYLEHIGGDVWAKEAWYYVENLGLVQIDVYDEKDVNKIVLQLKLKERAVILDGTFGSGDIYASSSLNR